MDYKNKTMEKSFIISAVVVVIIGFSASAYIFSQIDFAAEIGNATNDMSAKKVMIIEQINHCMEQNTVASGSISLNSFETNLLSNMIKQVQEADTYEQLDRISQQIYAISPCKAN